ncbi:MAG: hypothetical protein IPQ13_14120 [Holophagaceae bacterium]|nr:hypothetical protein [Holophagaceae bacterium]
MKFRYLILALLPSLASAQAGGFHPPPWSLADHFGLGIFPLQSLRGLVPEATVIVESDYLPLYTEREIRFLEFRATLLADLRSHLESGAPSPSPGAGVPLRYAEGAGPRMYPLGGLRWK